MPGTLPPSVTSTTFSHWLTSFLTHPCFTDEKTKVQKVKWLVPGHTAGEEKRFEPRIQAAVPVVDEADALGLEVERSQGLSFFLVAWAWVTLVCSSGLLLSYPLPLRPGRAPTSRKGDQRQPWSYMKGPTLLWELASHLRTPSHRNVSKSQFDPISSVCSHSRSPPPGLKAAVCCPQPEVCGVPVAPKAGMPLQDFPWVHFQSQRAHSPPHMAASETPHPPWGGTVTGHLFSPFK